VSRAKAGDTAGAQSSADCHSILSRLQSLYDPVAVEGMARYGINPRNNYGVSVRTLREIARETGTDHALARKLWASGVHDARILASIVDDPNLVTARQMESWVADFDSWDVCDQGCALFARTRFAWQKAAEWSERPEEYVRRAGFVIMARLAVSDKKADDSRFEQFLPIIRETAADDRNYVKKAVNWALRQIGKRNLRLNGEAIATAEGIARSASKSARWVASDALRELTSEPVQARLRGR
jgi:3-methyladenine DNA glycosylase AlkD